MNNKKMKKNKVFINRKGMTMVELLVSIFIFSIILVATSAVAATYLRGSISIKKFQQNSEELSLAVNTISKDIRMSNTLVAVNGSNSNIALTTNNAAAGGNITYSFAGGRLTRSGAVIANNVQGIFYVQNSAGIPRVTILIKKIDPSGANDYSTGSVQTTVSMRSGYK